MRADSSPARSGVVGGLDGEPEVARALPGELKARHGQLRLEALDVAAGPATLGGGVAVAEGLGAGVCVPRCPAGSVEIE